jgi:hypothetical protein
MNLAANTATALKGADEVINYLEVTHKKNNIKKVSLVLAVLMVGILSQSTPAYASGSLVVNGGHHERRYTEVIVGTDRYYYDDGIYYTGGPGNYIVVDAPIGAVIYNTPVRYERVSIDGAVYFRSNNVYYRHSGRGYEVVRPHDRGRHDEGRGNHRR